jgi:hypothetical protein
MHSGFFFTHLKRKNMLIRPITYENYEGEEVTETFHFHLGRLEIIDLEVEQQEGFKEMIEKIIATNDRKALVEQFKKIILKTYGVRSEDGKKFTKTDELRDDFAQSPAFEALIIEFLTVEDAAVNFFTEVLPRNMQADIAKANAAAAAAPTPPVSPVPPSQPAV